MFSFWNIQCINKVYILVLYLVKLVLSLVEYYYKTEACISPNISHWFLIVLSFCDATKNNCHNYFGVPLQRIRNFPMLVPQQLSIWIACNDPAADSALYSFHRTLRSFQKPFIPYEIHNKKIDGYGYVMVCYFWQCICSIGKNGKWKRIKDEVLCSFFNCALSKFLHVCFFGFFAYLPCQSNRWRSWCHTKSLEPVYLVIKSIMFCGCALELFIRA